MRHTLHMTGGGETIPPEHDAPVCTKPNCEGSLVPVVYADGRILQPRHISTPGTTVYNKEWMTLRCAGCGRQTPLPATHDLLQAWYSAGAHEQRLYMDASPIRESSGLDIITSCERCPCLDVRVECDTGNDVLVCSADETVEIQDDEVHTMPADCPRVGRTATWPREVKS